MKDLTLQKLLVKKLRERIPSYTSPEHEVASILNISPQRAYACFRLLEAFSLDQAYQLAVHYGISLDSLSPILQPTIPFKFQSLDYNIKTLEDYFESMLKELRSVNLFGSRQMIYAAFDFPIFTLFQFPELAAFKLFFWGKSVYDLPEFHDQKFSLKNIDTDAIEIGELSLKQYLKIPSIEIWSSEIVNNTLRQVFHHWRAGDFAHAEDALFICDKVGELLNHVEKQAELGRKFRTGKNPPRKGNFKLFFNETAISNNIMLLNTDTTQLAYVSQNTLNLLSTDNHIFCLQTDIWLRFLIQKSINISRKNANKRIDFFEYLRDNIRYIKMQISA